MSFEAILTQIITLITGGITGIGQAVGSGLSTLMQAIFLDTTGQTTALSVFGALVIIFAAISLGFTLCRWAVNFITSLGNRNR